MRMESLRQLDLSGKWQELGFTMRRWKSQIKRLSKKTKWQLDGPTCTVVKWQYMLSCLFLFSLRIDFGRATSVCWRSGHHQKTSAYNAMPSKTSSNTLSKRDMIRIILMMMIPLIQSACRIKMMLTVITLKSTLFFKQQFMSNIHAPNEHLLVKKWSRRHFLMTMATKFLIKIRFRQ